MSLRCRSCSSVFDDKTSYEVHCLYAHTSNNISVTNTPASNNCSASLTNGSAARVTDTDAQSTTTSTTACHENHHPHSSFHHIAGQDPLQNCGDRMYDIPSGGHLAPAQSHNLHHHQPTYPVSYNMMPASDPQTDYARNPSTTVLGQNSGGYAPYERVPSGYHPPFHNAQFNMSMPPTGLELPHAFNSARFGNALPPAVNGARGTEPQSVLDLDSHKVLYNARPNGEDSQDSSDHWSIDAHFVHHQQQQQQQQQHLNLANGNSASVVTPNGRASNSTPLASPDFNSVSTTQISSSDSHPTGRSSSKAGKNSNGSWKSNEARRPKTYNCSACNKWFTSSGHLKRHYNTTLHKNAVKQSGAPDPATLPVSAHHHPQKDPTYSSSSRHQVKASPSPPDHAASPPSSKMPDYTMSSMAARNVASHSFPHSPNLMAGPTEVPGGLLHHPSYTQSQQDLKSPSPITSLQQQQAGLLQHSNHTSYLQSFSTLVTPQPTMHQFFQQPTQTTLYPNFKPPHVSTSPQVIQPQITGNLMDDVLNSCIVSVGVDDSKLPSFACIQKSEGNGMWNAEQFISALDHGNVGGSSETIDNTANMLLCEIKQERVEHLEEDIDQHLNQLLTIQPPPCQSLPIEDTKVTSSTGNTSPVSSSVMAKFRCDTCNKTFNKTCYLTQHNKSFHGVHRPFKCVKCGKRFADKESYGQHLEKHAGNKPHKCEQCPKTFNHKTDLRRHACLHSNTRPYNCDICGKGFIRKDHMIKHRETHQNRRSVQRKVKIEKEKMRTKMVLTEVAY